MEQKYLSNAMSPHCYLNYCCCLRRLVWTGASPAQTNYGLLSASPHRPLLLRIVSFPHSWVEENATVFFWFEWFARQHPILLHCHSPLTLLPYFGSKKWDLSLPVLWTTGRNEPSVDSTPSFAPLLDSNTSLVDGANMEVTPPTESITVVAMATTFTGRKENKSSICTQENIDASPTDTQKFQKQCPKKEKHGENIYRIHVSIIS